MPPCHTIAYLTFFKVLTKPQVNIKEKRRSSKVKAKAEQVQYNFIPSVNPVALGTFCGAKVHSSHSHANHKTVNYTTNLHDSISSGPAVPCAVFVWKQSETSLPLPRPEWGQFHSPPGHAHSVHSQSANQRALAEGRNGLECAESTAAALAHCKHVNAVSTTDWEKEALPLKQRERRTDTEMDREREDGEGQRDRWCGDGCRSGE